MRLRSEGLSWREIDGESVLLDLQTSTYLRANRTGTFLLKELVEGSSRDELVSRLADAYDLPVSQAESEVQTFLGSLVDRSLLLGS